MLQNAFNLDPPVQFLVTNESACQRRDQAPVLVDKIARPHPQPMGNPNRANRMAARTATASCSHPQHSASHSPGEWEVRLVPVVLA